MAKKTTTIKENITTEIKTTEKKAHQKVLSFDITQLESLISNKLDTEKNISIFGLEEVKPLYNGHSKRFTSSLRNAIYGLISIKTQKPISNELRNAYHRIKNICVVDYNIINSLSLN